MKMNLELLRQIRRVLQFNMYRITYNKKKNCADFVMVIMHGGNEHNPILAPVSSHDITFADLGADAVIGMHPHCIQGFEIYNNTR